MQSAHQFQRWLMAATLAWAWMPAAFAAPPMLLGLTPDSATAGGAAFTLTIHGTGFTPASISRWGVTALKTTYKSATELTADIPASLIATAGTSDITVVTNGGRSSGILFTVYPPLAAIAGANARTAAGAGFNADAAGVTQRTTVVAANSITTSANSTTTPANSVTATASSTTTSGVSGGLAVMANSAPFLVALNTSSPAPTISRLSPAERFAGQGAFMLTVDGANFSSAATVYWGTTPLSTTFFQSGIVEAAVPASLVATAGTASVTVTTAGGTSASSTFTVTPAPPAITSLSPDVAAAGGAKFTLTVNGVNFGSTSQVYWQSTWLATIYVSATQLTAAVPASLLATAGTVGVRVYTSGGSGWSQTSFFTINPAPPAITSLSPASATAGSAGFMLTIYGAAFTPAAATTWGTTSLGTIYVSPTQLTVAVPASLVVTSGTGSITVTTAAGASAPAAFTINPAPPVISGLSTNLVTAGGAAFTLAITGANFTSGVTASWGAAALATSYISPTQLTAVVPASLIATAGTASVTLSTAAGTSAPVTITINPALKITTTALPSGTAGNAYSGPVSVTGGVPGYTWTVTGLPSNFSYFNTSGGTLTITGTPVSSGSITFQVSVTDTFGSAAGPVTYTIQVDAGPSGANNGSLSGNYVCLFQGSFDDDGSRWATLASFQADGQGNFASGVFDTNSRDIGSASGTMSGSYSIGSDNNGMASIHTILTDGAAGIQTAQWAVALSGAAQPARQFRMVEADDLGTLPSYQQGTANCYLASPSAFAASAISGNSFVFGLDGEDNSGNLKASAGFFSASGGSAAIGNIDSALGGGATIQTTAFTATYTTPDPATGRFTMTLSAGGNPTGFTVYIIDSSRMFLLDNTSNDGEQAGNMRTQQQASFSAASVAGPIVLYLRGAEFNSSGSAPSGYYANIFQGVGDGAGNMTINQSYANGAGVYAVGQSNGGPISLAFDSAHPGRATFPTATGTAYLYLFSAGSAFEIGVGGNGSLDSGWLEPQTQTSFTNAALAGDYFSGELPRLSVSSSGSVGEYDLTSGGAITGAITTSGPGVLNWDQALGTTYGWDTTAPGTGAFLAANGASGAASCVVVSATKFVCIPQTDPSPSVQIMQQ